MMTPNGGVFGRNPKFSNVTVENNLTVNGDFTLGDDITITDTLLVGGQATFRGGISSIPNASAATTNTVLGSSAGNAVTTGARNTYVGTNAGLLATTASDNTMIGWGAGDAITTSGSQTMIGSGAGGATTSGQQLVAIGTSAAQSNVTGSYIVAIGTSAALNIGASAASATINSIFIGTNAGRYRGSGVDTLTRASDSIFIGDTARANDNSQTNQVVIGNGVVGDGTNTTVLNTASTTSTRINGTATSVLRTAGDTLRIDNARTPATAGAAGNAGDICWDANYIYVCVAANTWKRAAIATWP